MNLDLHSLASIDLIVLNIEIPQEGGAEQSHETAKFLSFVFAIAGRIWRKSCNILSKWY